jgi:hypothetical protein
MKPFYGPVAELLPPPVRGHVRRLWYGLKRASQWPSARWHPWRRESIQRLAKLKDVHRGERCFVIGNGPSLNETDVSRLENEYTFGMNRIYLAFDEWGFQTSYLVSVNDLVIQQCHLDFQELDIPKFFSWRARNLLYPNGTLDDQTHFLFTTYTGPKFAQDARARMWEGATVTYVCLQLAFHMGFEKAVLIGVDHSFSTQGDPNTTVVSEGADPDHFSEDYFGKGFRWQLPDLATSEIAYRMARDAYEDAGREIVDATIGGKLEGFPKVNYLDLFS